MESTYFEAITGTNDDTGRGSIVVYAGGPDLDALVRDVASRVGALMVEHAPSPRFNGEIQVVWVSERLPASTPYAELQGRVCDQILRLDLAPARDIKLSFQVGDGPRGPEPGHRRAAVIRS